MSALLNKLRRRHSHEYAPYQHLEKHFESAEIVRDTIIGLSGLYKSVLVLCKLYSCRNPSIDGLTVPFALAAGLSSLGSSKLVIYGGAAGNIFITSWI